MAMQPLKLSYQQAVELAVILEKLGQSQVVEATARLEVFLHREFGGIPHTQGVGFNRGTPSHDHSIPSDDPTNRPG